MRISRRGFITVAGAASLNALMKSATAFPDKEFAKPDVLLLAAHEFEGTLKNVHFVSGYAQLKVVSQWLAEAPNRAIAGLLDDSDGVLLTQLVERGSAHWLWTEHHVMPEKAAASWSSEMAINLENLRKGPEAYYLPGSVSSFMSFAVIHSDAQNTR